MEHIKPTECNSRRRFLRNSAFAAAFFIVPRHVLGRGFVAPSDKKNLAIIGCGKQSSHLANSFMRLPNVQMVGASDVFAEKLQRMQQQINRYYTEKNNQAQYKSCGTHPDFRELLSNKSIDAVIIATPDHWHAVMAVEACRAGKDVYCEKPLSLTVAEGRAMVKAARKHQRVFQTGSMQRSSAEFRKAVNLVRGGHIGKITAVEVNIGPPVKAYDLPEQNTPAGLDWQRWLGPNMTYRAYNKELAPDLEYEKKIWPNWRNYIDFGGGMMTDWGAHMFDIAQWGLNMDSTGPVSLQISGPGQQGGLLYTYANGVTMTHRLLTSGTSPYCKFVGDGGEILVQRGSLITTPSSLKDKVLTDAEQQVYKSDNHYADFISAMESRNAPICDVEIGHRSATIGNIGNIAYLLGRSLTWDPAEERFTNDAAANKMLSRELKKEWRIKRLGA
ncbi:MAG: gfo/Idh/MocA family oxidoreductase [Bacteroidetes bacterium]|nr:MAG: gfo/Idh/MocA family oxidoreductase [Bacteroidota bacterium]